MPYCCRWLPLASGSCAPSGGDHDLLGLLILVTFPTHEAALHDLVEQGLVADLQEPRRLGAIPADPIEDFLDRHALGVTCGLPSDVLEADRGVETRPHLRARTRARHGTETTTQVADDLEMHGPRAAEDDHALHGVLQLPDVAGPVVLEERALRLGRYLDGATVLHVELLEEMIEQHRDLFPA